MKEARTRVSGKDNFLYLLCTAVITVIMTMQKIAGLEFIAPLLMLLFSLLTLKVTAQQLSFSGNSLIAAGVNNGSENRA